MTAREDSRRKTILGLLALFAGGFVPIQLVTLSFGYAQYGQGVKKGPELLGTAHQFAQVYMPFAYLPALGILIGVVLYSRRHYPDLYRLIIVGLGMGAIATLALDAAREAGVIHGWLPGDTPVMFGRIATGSSDFATFYPVGLFVHYMNGASFGLVYAFVFGKRDTVRGAVLWAIAWALVLELGMMTLPPMGPMVGLFGSNFAWPQLFLLTLVAHVMFGIALGLLVQHFLRDEDRSWVRGFLQQRSPHVDI